MQRQFDIFINEAPDVLTVHWGWVIALGLLVGVLGLVHRFRSGCHLCGIHSGAAVV